MFVRGAWRENESLHLGERVDLSPFVHLPCLVRCLSGVLLFVYAGTRVRTGVKKSAVVLPIFHVFV